MARPIRIQYPDAVYHVMGLGNQGKEIFHDDLARRCFLETLGQACEKTGWRVHAYRRKKSTTSAPTFFRSDGFLAALPGGFGSRRARPDPFSFKKKSSPRN